MDKLVRQARTLISAGVYDQHELFNLLFRQSGKHYATVRTAIHLAKTRAY